MRKHRAALKDIDKTHVPKDLMEAAKAVWDEVIEMGEQHGFRNAQATVLAPTGTIGFMMDCDTTGVEPDIALVKYKKLVGGGLMKIVNQTVPMALKKLGYTQTQVKEIVEYIDEHETIEGAPHIKDTHLPVFDCAFKPARGVRSIHYMGHIKMVGATQPFLSGAISKTVNVPKEATVEEIEQAYIDSWRLGAKAVSIYRDGSKRTQPLNTSQRQSRPGERGSRCEAPRRRGRSCPTSGTPSRTSSTSPATRATSRSASTRTACRARSSSSWRRKGRPSRALPTPSRRRSRYALQYGVPLQDLVDKFSHVRFEPSGMTKNPDVRFAKSIVDYIFRWMATKFLSQDAQYRAGVNNREDYVIAPEQLPLDVAAAAGASPTAVICVEADVVVRRDAEPGGRAAVLDVRLDHGPQRVVLQVRQLRNDERMCLIRDQGSGIRD